MNTIVTPPRREVPRPVMVDHKLDVVGSEAADIQLPIPNPTLLPDRIIASMSPVLIIRHPIFTFTSYMRAATVFGGTAFDSEFQLMATYRWQRIIYDFYREYYDKADSEWKKDWPIVVDGDKLVEDTKGQMQKFCALTCICWHDQGVTFAKDSSLDVEEHMKKWTEEWDERVAQQLKKAVEASMEDYEYLLKYSI
ncbi:hypothetical protein DFJ43DRAFT_1053905 [Lentinula guzmanii]|uniref:Uncharacterized protein n=1 Tax=Lentinula guzmanii TaxID=2804957 RepID=A0AA38N4M3_9AGAR|nr:hypothetical protein DFJ43DRAFT_1053905 [Lentinula guzmanii]